jgi:gamma-glutamylcyclotransferase (GGCT)/AIG2-like uncharacterized protein YtfP
LQEIDPDHRLVVYGSLAPGLSNHGQLAGLAGTWAPGVVRGHRLEAGWGPGQAFPGLRLDAAGPPVEVLVFTSADLPAHWARLDAFEGADYGRVLVEVEIEGATVRGNIYAVGAAA